MIFFQTSSILDDFVMVLNPYSEENDEKVSDLDIENYDISQSPIILNNFIKV